MQKEVVPDNDSEETSSIIEEEEKNKSLDERKENEEDETIQEEGEEEEEEEEDVNDEEDDVVVYQSDYESESTGSDDDNIIEVEPIVKKSVDLSDEIENNSEKMESAKNAPHKKKDKCDKNEEKPGESSTDKTSSLEIRTEISPIESTTPTEMHLIKNIDLSMGQCDFNFDCRRLNINNSQPQQNLSFSNERIREIDRHNKILLQKILKKNPLNETMRSTDRQTNQCKRFSSSAINRRKMQKQIELDNQLLSKKLSSIALRKPTNS